MCTEISSPSPRFYLIFQGGCTVKLMKIAVKCYPSHSIEFPATAGSRGPGPLIHLNFTINSQQGDDSVVKPCCVHGFTFMVYIE